MMDVALFPIPNSVNFPGVPIPLHVFEPRYRQMVKYCIENDVLMGVCHTEKVIHENKRHQTREEALSTNHSTYKPCEVFSAGKVELLEELEDGRLAIMVHFDKRLKLKKERQTLPFNIWCCEPYEDTEIAGDELLTLKRTQENIMKVLMALGEGNDPFLQMLSSDKWQTLSVTNFSYMVAGLFEMQADTKQGLLEMTSAKERLDFIEDLLASIQS